MLLICIITLDDVGQGLTVDIREIEQQPEVHRARK